MRKTITVAVAALALAACTTSGGPKEIGGTLLGGGLGALVGSQIGSGKGQLAATATGALMGAFLGREAGVSLDRADRLSAGGRDQAGYAPAATGWARPRSAPRLIGRDCTRLPRGGLACEAPDGTWTLYE